MADESRDLLHTLIWRRAEGHPDAVAVVCGDHALSYGELAARARILAARLRREHAGPDHPVGIFLPRSVEMVVALLGILEAGAAYLSLDPSFPVKRLARMVEVGRNLAATPIVVGQPAEERGPVARQLEDLVQAEVRWVCPPGSSAPESSEEDGAQGAHKTRGAGEPSPDNLAYIIFTSGSTGEPKGVQISHRGALSFLAAMDRRLGLGDACDVLAITTLSFDISVLEVFQPLLRGARVLVVDRETGRDGHALARLAERQRADVLQATPATWRLLLSAGWQNRHGMTLLSGGEALLPDIAARLRERAGRLWNLYGPTETTVWATAGEVGDGVIDVGSALENTRIWVADRRLRALPAGEVGEVVLTSDGVSRGYLGQPGATAASFVPDPFTGRAGSRLYRVGDLGRWRVDESGEKDGDGRLLLLGRIDHQVKLRGFRVELGEIEVALHGQPGVRQAAVALRETPAGEAGDSRLVAYLVLETERAPESKGELAASPAPDELVVALREGLREELPEHMVPSDFMVLGRLPRTPTGKLDRASLPAPPRRHVGVPPRTAVESALCERWAEILGYERVGIDDNFFDLGGHSLLAVHVTTHLRERFGLDLPLAVLLHSPTVESLARVVEEATAEASQAASSTTDHLANHLVLLGGDDGAHGQPLFCVHGIGGNVFRLVQLARRLGRTVPFYGLQGWSSLEETAFLGDVAQMAGRYLAEIRRQQPAGPYRLAGYSLGYVVAYEMARCLEEAGEEVEFLGFVGYSETRPTDSSVPEDLRAVQFEVGLAHELTIPIDLDRIRALAAEERLPYVVETGCAAGILPAGFGVADARRFIAVFNANAAALQHWTPRPLRCAATLFVAEADEAGDPQQRWSALVQGGIERVDVPGNHATMLISPQVEILAEAVEARLGRGRPAEYGD